MERYIFGWLETNAECTLVGNFSWLFFSPNSCARIGSLPVLYELAEVGGVAISEVCP